MNQDDLDLEEHAAFVEAVSSCFAEHAGPAVARTLLDDPRGDDPVLRDRTVRELGLPGLAVDEALGGAGGSLRLLADVALLAGRQLVGGPLLPTAITTLIVARLGDEGDHGRLLPAIAAGELTATLALHDRADDPVRIGQDGLRLSGTRTAVLDGLHADRLLVPVATDDGWIVAVVTADADGITRSPLPSLDLTRRIADVTFDGTPATVLGAGPIDDETWQRALDSATVLVAADATGVAAEAVDRAVAYARERHQFGRPIGSFQAVKHALARAHVDVESARAAVEHAAVRADGPAGPAGPEACALAGLHAARVAADVTRTAIQVHGGVGFTWEHDAHLFHRRALADAALLRPVPALERRLVTASVAAAA